MMFCILVFRAALLIHWSFLCDKNGTTIDHGCHDYRINHKQALLSGPLSVTTIDPGNHDHCINHRARN